MHENKGSYFHGKKGSLNKEKLLIVEGQDDAYFFDKILENLGADSTKTGIIYMEGNDIKGEINLLSKSRELGSIIKKICIIMDADEDYRLIKKNIHKAINIFNFKDLPPNKFFQSPCGRFDLGYTLLPNHNENGNLELACLKTINENENYKIIEKFYSEYTLNFGALDRKFKRLARIFLSLTPGRPNGVGCAFKNEIFDCNHPSLNSLIEFIREL